MRPSQRGFTLVELLVVIGIIALLVGILLPVISRARRAAEAARCLANLKSIGNNNALYVAQAGRLPLFWALRGPGDRSVPPGSTGTTIFYTVYNFGGKDTHNNITIFGYMPEQHKPLTGVADRSVGPADPYNGTRLAASARHQRELFRCPADSGNIGRNGYANFLTPGVPSPYESFGTSYISNRYFIYDESMDEPIRRMVYSPPTPENVDYCNRAMSKLMLKWNAARTVLVTDIWFNLSLWYESPWVGAHTSNSTHNVLFLDGHAEAVLLGNDDVKRVVPGRRLYRTASWSVYDDRKGLPKSSGSPLGATDPFGDTAVLDPFSTRP